MEEEQQQQREDSASPDVAAEDVADPLELILFHVNECYVYLIPPRKTAASYRADEWNVNKWVWEGALKVVSRGEQCIIRLEDKATGELYARAFLSDGEPHPVEPVIDSSRYFVLRIEESIDGRQRHAFIGIGFRERTEAYDFQAALHDHMKYLNKKKTAEEMEQHYQSTSSVDYSLKEGEKLVLNINHKGGQLLKSLSALRNISNLSLGESTNKEGTICLPPPPAPLSPVSPVPRNSFRNDQANVENTNSSIVSGSTTAPPPTIAEGRNQDDIEDDFGDFQAAS